MRRLPNRTTTPPGGWRFTVPETGKTIGPFSGYRQLHIVLTGHYQSAGYDMPGDIQKKVEAQICDNEPEYCGDEPKGYVERAVDGAKNLYHTFHNAKNCLATLVSHRAGSGEKPSQELLNARAKTCSECPLNQPIQDCATCHKRSLNSLIQKLVGTGKTPYDAQLQYCAVCHCNLRAKISTKHEAIWQHLPKNQKEKLPSNCWILTEAHAET